MHSIQSKYGSKKGLIRFFWHQLTWHSDAKLVQHKPLASNRLVFVCHGNICRSALAESIGQKLGLNATSIGLQAPDGEPADKRMIELAARHGYDMREHQTKSLQSFEPYPNDLYLAMDITQCKKLSNRLGDRAAISLLGLWASPKRAYLHDPYSCGDAYFNTCYQLIHSCVVNIKSSLDGSHQITNSSNTV